MLCLEGETVWTQVCVKKDSPRLELQPFRGSSCRVSFMISQSRGEVRNRIRLEGRGRILGLLCPVERPCLSDCTGQGEDLIMWVNVEPLCCVCETFIRLYINDTLIKRKESMFV